VPRAHLRAWMSAFESGRRHRLSEARRACSTSCLVRDGTEPDPATTQVEPLQAVPLGLIRLSQPKLSIRGDFWHMALTKEAERLGMIVSSRDIRKPWKWRLAGGRLRFLEHVGTASGVQLTGLTALDPGRLYLGGRIGRQQAITHRQMPHRRR
jgi:hypothetical protein